MSETGQSMRLVIDVVVGSIVVGGVLAALFLPDVGRVAKRVCWVVADATFNAVIRGAVAVLHFWEVAMDRLWRIRCWLTSKHPRPF